MTQAMTRGYHGLLGKTAGDNVGAPECSRALGTSAGTDRDGTWNGSVREGCSEKT